MGSILQDNITDIMPQQQQQQQKQEQDHFTDKLANLSSERRKSKRVCGLRYRSILLMSLLAIAIVVVVWYFVWPRIPNLALDDVDNVGTIQVLTSSTQKSMSTQWSLNMTVDNTANWVPTRINTIDVIITDDKTQQAFGSGQTGWLVLSPRKKSMISIILDIYYESYNANDTTFQDLYNACGVQVNSNALSESQQGVLNVTLSVTYHISGIVWPTTKNMHINSLICPTS